MSDSGDGSVFAAMVTGMIVLHEHLGRQADRCMEKGDSSLGMIYYGGATAINAVMEAAAKGDAGVAVDSFEGVMSVLRMGRELVNSGMSVEDTIDVLRNVDERVADNG